MIRKITFSMIFLLAIFGLFSTSFAQKNSFSERLSETIPKLLETSKSQGVAVGIIEGGKTILLRGYGKADVKTNRQMTADTIINVASISKPVTTWGILRLVENEKLNLDAPINPLLKNWSLPKSEFDNNQVTFKRLLSHTAGTSVAAVPWFSMDSKLPTLLEVLNGKAGEKGAVKVEKEPGKAWSYSGGGYAILQFWIEEQTNKTLNDYMKNEVFKPLGMRKTDYSANQQTAILYDENGNPIAPYQVIAESAGGLNTTARDFVELLKAYFLTNRGQKKIISPESFKAMITPIAKVELEGVSSAMYGLGHGVHQTKSGDTIVYHSGGNPGVRAYFLVSLKKGNGLFVVANSDNSVPVLQEIIRLWGEHNQTDLQPVY